MKDVLKYIGIALLVVLISVLIMVYGFGMEMFGLELGKHIENKRTDVTRQTNQYVTTQQGLLNGYARDYLAAEEDGSTGQCQAILNQMRDVAVTLDREDVPETAAQILARNGGY